MVAQTSVCGACLYNPLADSAIKIGIPSSIGYRSPALRLTSVSVVVSYSSFPFDTGQTRHPNNDSGLARPSDSPALTLRTNTESLNHPRPGSTFAAAFSASDAATTDLYRHGSKSKSSRL